MTVSYTGDVANASDFGCFNKILLKWRGSVYKLIYKVGFIKTMYNSKKNSLNLILKELLAYLLIYLLVNVIYRKVLIPNSQCDTKESRDSNCKEVSRDYRDNNSYQGF